MLLNAWRYVGSLFPHARFEEYVFAMKLQVALLALGECADVDRRIDGDAHSAQLHSMCRG